MPTANRLQNYIEIAQALGVHCEKDGTWAYVGRTPIAQGWKLHLSTIPVDAIRFLELVVPWLHDSCVPFKFVHDEATLRQLNEGTLGATQVGKCLTLYPPSDNAAREIARSLIKLTKGFRGPVVVTDIRLGDVVYARYGPFKAELARDRLGNVSILMKVQDSTFKPHQYQVPFQRTENIHCPFDDFPHPEISSNWQSIGRLFGPGYLLIETLKPNPKGSVFLALDMREQKSPKLCVLKEGRAHCCSDSNGRDVRTRLQRQVELHSELAGSLRIPEVGSYFEVAQNGYLPLEYVNGRDFTTLADQPYCSRSRDEQISILFLLDDLVRTVQELHSAGFVHRDITPTNVRLGSNGNVYLLDLEIAHRIGSRDAPFTQGTAGFMSLQQTSDSIPIVEDDVYSIAAVIAFVLSGIDPRRFLYHDTEPTRLQLQSLCGVSESLTQILVCALSNDAAKRPSLILLRKALQEESRCFPSADHTGSLDGTALIARTSDMIPSVTHGLLKGVLTDKASGLWLSQTMGQGQSQWERASGYRLYRSANRGVAGVVYCLSALAELGFGGDLARQRVETAVDWLLSHAPTTDDQLPGLHFGEAGVAVAIARSIRAGLIPQGAWFQTYLSEALSAPLDWHDLTHGAAGQGIAVLSCAQFLRADAMRALVDRCANYLVSTQDADGGWTVPDGAPGLSGDRFTGFAHGVSGIVYFLCEHAWRFNNEDSLAAARRAGDWLIAQSKRSIKECSLYWPNRIGGEEVWSWWCHGAPGVGLAFLKLFERYGNTDHRQIAIEALLSHPIEVRYSNLSQCHGISGLGEIYLEAFRILQEDRWLHRAARIADVLNHLGKKSDSGVTWLVEDSFNPTADLMVGCSGVVHFLTNFASGGLAFGMPLMPPRN